MGFLFGRSTPTMVTAEQACSGREHPILPKGPHAVLGSAMDSGDRWIILGMGCFWGSEKLLWQIPGVVTTAAGYAGGFTENPTYEMVCSGQTGHAEVVRVAVDNDDTLRAVLTAALEAHDPTQGFRQGHDVGTQYRSAIYTQTAKDLQSATELVRAYGTKLADAGFGPVTTELSTLADTPTGTFYFAEPYHQQYLWKNPAGYCPVHSTGVACP